MMGSSSDSEEVYEAPSTLKVKPQTLEMDLLNQKLLMIKSIKNRVAPSQHSVTEESP